MTVRPIQTSDLPRILELQQEYEWKLGPDFICGSVVVDGEGIVRAVGGAWMLAEAHMLIDPTWKSPGAREAALLLLHEEMSTQLPKRGVYQIVTWFDEVDAFVRRLGRLGWIKSELKSWHFWVR